MPVKVHVNSHVIRANKKNGETNPPLTIIRNSKTRSRHMEVELIGPAKIVYSPDKPLSCGAKVWVECADAIGIDRVEPSDGAQIAPEAGPDIGGHRPGAAIEK